MAWFASTTMVINLQIYNPISNCQYGSHRDLLTYFLLFVGEAVFFFHLLQTNYK